MALGYLFQLPVESLEQVFKQQWEKGAGQLETLVAVVISVEKVLNNNELHKNGEEKPKTSKS